MNWGHPGRGKVLLLAGDCALAVAAVILAQIIDPVMSVSFLVQAGLIVVFVCVYAVCFYVFDLYDVQLLNGTRTFTRLLAATVSGTCMLSLFLYMFQSKSFTRGTLGIAVSFLLVGSMAWRGIYKRHRSYLLKKRGILFVGAEQDAANLQAIANTENSPYELRGFVRIPETAFAARSEEYLAASIESRRDRPAPLAAAVAAGASYPSPPQRGSVIVMERTKTGPVTRRSEAATTRGFLDFGVVSGEKLEDLICELEVDTVVLRQNSAIPDLAGTLTGLRFCGIRICTMPDLCSEILEELPIEMLSEAWFSFATGFYLLHQKFFRKIKRVSDILLAGAGLVLTLPIAIATGIALKLESPGPVLFKQWRVGRMEKPFTLLKFRSMRLDAEADGKAQWAAEMDPRATHVGRILRLTHIDEIPQMINVLLGEMSFVGPRPERPVFVEQLKELVPFYSLRHHVPPGITGWAQVNYPYGASVEDAKRKLQYDLFYVRNASPTMDLRILLRTARVIMFRRGSR